MKPAPFAYHAPTTVADAVALLARLSADDARIIAGGQSLMPMMALRLARPRHVIDINGIPELRSLTVQDGILRIGATVRHRELESAERTGGGRLGRMLAEVARNVAHPPIRSRGTFCGSVANSDPASEWCLVTVTTDAEITLQSAVGTRTIPASSFYSGAMTNAMAPDELVVQVQMRMLPSDAHFGFYEVSRRAGDFALAAALVIYRLANGRILDPRIGIGGVESQPCRVAAGEAVLAGQAPTLDLFRRAAAACNAAAKPLDDGYIPAAYRRDLVEAVVERALERSLA